MSNALFVYNTSSGGTGRFERHIAQHTSPKPNVINLPKPLPAMSKYVIAKCAAMAVTSDLRPISFTDQKERMLHFFEAVFKAGQATPVSDVIDRNSLLPCAKTVSAALSKLVVENRAKFQELLPEMIKIGGVVSTDGVTLKVQDKQFYDLTLHYMEVIKSSPFDPLPKFRIACKTLLLQEKKGEGNAEQIRKLLGDALWDQYGCDIDALTKGFTMVTDNASMMARVARASVSTRLAPLSETWLGCLVHQINTAMKGCISELPNHEELSCMFSDLQNIKKKSEFLTNICPKIAGK